MQSELDAFFFTLLEHICSLYENYLKKHVENSLATPTEYDLDVRTFCILSHAAIEDFIEIIVSKLMLYAVDEYTNNHRVSEITACLLHFKSKPTSDDANTPIRSFDYLRKRLDNVKAAFSREIFENHGISLKYLINLLPPISIDISDEPKLLDSLSRLSEARGLYAHKFLDKGRLFKSISPEDAWLMVKDCLVFCDDILEKALAKMCLSV